MRLDDKEMGFVDGVTPSFNKANDEFSMDAFLKKPFDQRLKIVTDGETSQEVLEEVAGVGVSLGDDNWKIRGAAVNNITRIGALFRIAGEEGVLKSDDHFQVRDAAEKRIRELDDAVEMVKQVQLVKQVQKEISKGPKR